MSEKKQSMFVQQLSRSNSKIRTDRAERIGRTVANAHSKLIMDLEESIDQAENELEAMRDLSSDNQTTSMNVISPNFDANAYVTKIQNLSVEIVLMKEKLKIAKTTEKEWF